MRAQLEIAPRELRAQDGTVGIGEPCVHAHENLPFSHEVALAHEDLAHDAWFGRLHDLEKALRHQLPLRDSHDIEAPEDRPDEHESEEGEHCVEHRTRQRGWRARFAP
jgi:hypothetical protein